MEKTLGREEIKRNVSERILHIIGLIARPRSQIIIVNDLPKTHSSKIMRRILREINQWDYANFRNTNTLLNPDAVEQIIEIV
ncbi:MAG: hypothetical protein ACMUEM_01220 [Flavobacteriales bacterium AspAUS03]